MELPELSLAPGLFVVEKSPNSSSSESDSNLTRKRKFFDDQLLKTEQQAVHTSVDLQLKDPLPLDWEQCLDLEVTLSLSLSLSLLFPALNIIPFIILSLLISRDLTRVINNLALVPFETSCLRFDPF
jgi:hypothetical protein